MLDTNILRYLMKNQPTSIATRINSLAPDDNVSMSFVTYAEPIKGVVRSERPAMNRQNLAKLTRQIPVLFDVSRATCEQYAEQFSRLKIAGSPIGGNDLWIASHALVEAAILVTNNTREFAHITGLALEDWVA